MKKPFWVLLTAILFTLGLSVLLLGCGEDTGSDKAEYSVTVLSPDPENAPLSDITVSWISGSKTEGSAVTGEDGKATATLPAATYSIGLSGYTEGLIYTEVSVSASMRNITLTLEVQQVKYTTTVLDKAGAPAVGVKVSWTDGQNIAGTAVTDADGKAECEIAYGTYTVTLSDLPEGNIFDGKLTATGTSPAVQAELRNGVTEQYRVTVRSEGGLLFKKQAVIVYSGNSIVMSGQTDENGVYTFSAIPDTYTVRTVSVQTGYSANPVTVSATERDCELVLISSVITSAPAASTRYLIGDIIHDYSFTTPYAIDGAPRTYTISELLKTKDAILINNWGTNCSWCVQEMPAMQRAYQQYGDKIEILAVSNYQGGDSNSAIESYYNRNGYTFPMMRDTNGLSTKFELSSWPSTVVIDRYGAIARVESGAILDDEVWGRLIEKYIGDDYVQTFTPGDKVSDSITNEVAKPDVTVPADHYEKIAEALNDTTTFPQGASVVWRGETEYEMAWPFLIDAVDGVSSNSEKVLYSSNTGKANSMSIIYATVNVAPGNVFTFDYYAQTERNDIFSIVWDGKIIKQISGDSKGWQTCTLYSDLTEGAHSLAMTYIKDGSGNTGKDNVYIRNVRFTPIANITESTDMLRAAAYGTPAADANEFPYYAEVNLEADGYYHVDLSKLQNASLAGNDEKPLLFVNLNNATNWSAYSLNTLTSARDDNSGEYLFDFNFTIGGVTKDYRADFTKYLSAATASDIPDLVPVDKDLHDMLVAFMTEVSGETAHDNEWLEACYFYSHYGSGEPVGNPILGLIEKTAIPVTEGTFTANITRNTPPFPIAIYTFTPERSGVFKLHSLIPDKDAEQYVAQIWLYDDETSSEQPLVYNGDSRFIRDGVDEQNFTVYRYMEAGHKYYLMLAFSMQESGTYDVEITYVGDSATELRPASSNVFTFVPGENGEITGELILAGAIDYVLDEDGYYRVKGANGEPGDYIYLDVKYATALTTVSLSVLVEQYLRDPATREDLDYTTFDFRYMVGYFTEQDENGEEIYTYLPKVDLTTFDGTRYKDYTDIMKEYIAAAPTTGDLAGLIRVDQTLVEILTLMIETRVNMMVDGVGEKALENEWLRFCWYFRTYDSENI